MIDLAQAEKVEIYIGKDGKGFKLLVDIDGKCVCQVYKIKTLDIGGLAHLEKVE
jgi:hypothetical protein